MKKVLIVDNYDSFTYNLYQYIGELGAEVLVHRNDKIDLAGIRKLGPSHVIVSPGPGNPEDPAYFGVCSEVICELGKELPVLGVCLGHQGIGHCFGAKVVRARNIMHGKQSLVEHDSSGLFAGLPNPIEVMRYHSLVVEKNSIPDCLKVTANTLDDGEIMALHHVQYPVYGIQFHPESIGTPLGLSILKNFLG